MDPFQLILVILGLVLASGGVFMLFKAMQSESVRARGPLVPLAMTFMGLVLAYMAYTSYSTLDGMDIAIIILFIVALLMLLGIQFFVVGKHD
jgi:hypothetical protein